MKTTLIACFMLLGSTALASDYSYRSTLDATSARGGLNTSDAVLLTPQAGRGAGSASYQYFTRYRTSAGAITTSGAYRVREMADRVRYIGDGWILEALGDGSAVRYRNMAYLNRAAQEGYSLERQMTNDDLDRAGRAFIASDLSESVRLGTNETLVTFESSYIIQEVQDDTDRSDVTQTLGANMVAFSRTVNGQAVVGKGSKVAVIFAADGVAAGFDFDWPAYAQSTQRQSVYDIESINTRASRVLPVDPYGTDSRLERTECGYYDAGARRRHTTTPIQTACFYHYSVAQIDEPGSPDPHLGGTRAGYAYAVPAGVTVQPDSGWPLAMLLCTDGTGCGSMPRGSPPPYDPILGSTRSDD